MPYSRGRFHLYSDSSKFARGYALYQIQNGKPKLIAYVSKGLPEAAQNYSRTELEMCGLAINVASLAHLLKKVDFDAIVDNLALINIIKSKVEPATNQKKRMLEVPSSYSFNLYYIKGKDMILNDFLSRQKNYDSNLHKVIPMSFNMQNILHDRYHNIGERKEEGKYLIQTRMQSSSSDIILPAVHGVDKGISPSMKPGQKKNKL